MKTQLDAEQRLYVHQFLQRNEILRKKEELVEVDLTNFDDSQRFEARIHQVHQDRFVLINTPVPKSGDAAPAPP